MYKFEQGSGNIRKVPYEGISRCCIFAGRAVAYLDYVANT